MNRVELIGRITKDLELKKTGAGTSVVSFTLAINRPFKAKDGNTEADFINCVIYGTQSENFYRYCPKGSLVGLEGRIQTRTFEAKDSTKKYITEVIAERIEFLSTKKNNGSEPVEEVVQKQNEETSNDPFKEFGESVEVQDSDLPW